MIHMNIATAILHRLPLIFNYTILLPVMYDDNIHQYTIKNALI